MKEKKTLDEKLQEIKNEISIMQKNKEGYGFSYVNEESLLLKINAKMLELGLRLIPEIVPGTLKTEILNYKDKKDKDVTEILVSSDMKYTWKDIETKETEVINWTLVGQQTDGSQALGSGLTYTNRYFLLKYFNVSTSKDDPDEIRKKQKEEDEKKKMTAEQTKIKKIFAKAVTKYGTKDQVYNLLGTNKDEFVKNYSDAEKCKNLLEQIELLLEDKKEKENA